VAQPLLTDVPATHQPLETVLVFRPSAYQVLL
jgi:hypothetical protein